MEQIQGGGFADMANSIYLLLRDHIGDSVPADCFSVLALPLQPAEEPDGGQTDGADNQSAGNQDPVGGGGKEIKESSVH